MTVLEVTVLEGAGRTTRRPVDDLATAGPDERVFVAERDGGRIRFGDGEHGRRPYRPTILEVHYRTGVGATAPVSALSAPWTASRSCCRSSQVRGNARARRRE